MADKLLASGGMTKDKSVRLLLMLLLLLRDSVDRRVARSFPGTRSTAPFVRRLAKLATTGATSGEVKLFFPPWRVLWAYPCVGIVVAVYKKKNRKKGGESCGSVLRPLRDETVWKALTGGREGVTTIVTTRACTQASLYSLGSEPGSSSF